MHCDFFSADKKWTGKDTVEGKDDQVESVTKNPGNYY